MKLIVGLGNPEKKYDETRHNIGFELVNELAKKLGLSLKKESKFEAEIANGVLEGEEILLAKPLTYMNNSGSAIQKIKRFFKLEPEDILIVYDEVSVDFGKIKLSYERGAGGHHGIEDTIEKLGGAKNFYRLRIGVGPDPGGDRRADYVLSKFSKDEKKHLPTLIDFCVGSDTKPGLIEDWIRFFNDESDQKKQDRIIEAVNLFNAIKII